MRLHIGKQGFDQFLEFHGTGNSLKTAKNDAATKALQRPNLIGELRELVTSVSKSNLSYATKSDGDQDVKDLATQISKIVFHGTKTDAIYEAWLKAKQLNLPFTIDFCGIRKGISNTEIKVRIKMGEQMFTGNGLVGYIFFNHQTHNQTLSSSLSLPLSQKQAKEK